MQTDTIDSTAGTGDQMQIALAAIRSLAESNDEVNTHTYRTSRGEGPGNEGKLVPCSFSVEPAADPLKITIMNR